MVKEKKETFNQIKFDTRKWFDSIKNNKDMCGSYEFCVCCDKKEKLPCEIAYKKYTKMSKERRAVAKAKFNFDGKEVVFRSTVIENK